MYKIQMLLKEAIADPLPKYRLYCFVECYQVLKEAVVDPIATRYGMVCSECFVVDNMVYMCTVNNSNNTQHVWMCV